MALRRKITKTAYDALSEDLKKEYKVNAKNDQEYHLDVDDASELTRSLEREKARADKAVEDLQAAQETVTELEAKVKDAIKKSPDVESLERSWNTKLEKQKAAAEAKEAKLAGAIKATLIDGNANTLAAKISTAPALMARYIKDRLTVEFDGDTPALRILDKNGKPSAGTLAELETELLADKELSAMLIASKASGGSARSDPLPRLGSAKADGSNQPPALRDQRPRDLATSLTAAVEARRAAKQG